MIDLDLTQRDLAARLPELSQQTISRYLRGEGRNPLIHQAIADVLGVPVESLLIEHASAHATPQRRRKTRTATLASPARSLAASAQE